MKNSNQNNFRLAAAVCKNSTQIAPKGAIFHSKVKTLPPVGKGKHPAPSALDRHSQHIPYPPLRAGGKVGEGRGRREWRAQNV